MDTEGRVEKLGVRDLYNTQIALINAAEAISWARFNNYLFVNSVLIVAWATIYGPADAAARPMSDAASLVLMMISALGIVSGPVWSVLGRRARRILDEVRAQAEVIERTSGYWDQMYDESLKPLLRTKSLIEGGRHWAKSTQILRYGPWAFSLLYAILLGVVLLPKWTWGSLHLGMVIGFVLGLLGSWPLWLAFGKQK